MLTEFRVSGYKSLYDCTIPGLMPVNVFHGDNNVGKSNILEALEIFFRAVTIWKAGKSQLDEPLSLGTSEKLIEEWLEKKPLPPRCLSRLIRLSLNSTRTSIGWI
jgi:AAA15 family ATPase/GTPase